MASYSKEFKDKIIGRMLPPNNESISKIATETQINEQTLEYCNKLITAIKENEGICHYPKVSEKLNILEEILQDDIEHISILEDTDTKIGHKTADSSFFGYKTHIAMTEERIITAATFSF